MRRIRMRNKIRRTEELKRREKKREEKLFIGNLTGESNIH